MRRDPGFMFSTVSKEGDQSRRHSLLRLRVLGRERLFFGVTVHLFPHIHRTRTGDGDGSRVHCRREWRSGDSFPERLVRLESEVPWGLYVTSHLCWARVTRKGLTSTSSFYVQTIPKLIQTPIGLYVIVYCFCCAHRFKWSWFAYETQVLYQWSGLTHSPFRCLRGKTFVHTSQENRR